MKVQIAIRAVDVWLFRDTSLFNPRFQGTYFVSDREGDGKTNLTIRKFI